MTIDPIVLIVLVLAVYRLSRLIIEDVIFDRPRNAIWKRYPPETTMVGYWTTCYWCVSILMAGLMVVLYLLIPAVALVVALILAISAVVGIIDHIMNI